MSVFNIIQSMSAKWQCEECVFMYVSVHRYPYYMCVDPMYIEMLFLKNMQWNFPFVLV